MVYTHTSYGFYRFPLFGILSFLDVDKHIYLFYLFITYVCSFIFPTLCRIKERRKNYITEINNALEIQNTPASNKIYLENNYI